MTTEPLRVLSLGGGVQSTTLYLLEDWDLAIFADTGEESELTYAHLHYLQNLPDRAPIKVVTAGKLGDHLKTGTNAMGGRCSSIPAFTMTPESSKEGRTRRGCTYNYKLQPIRRAIREALGVQFGQRVITDQPLVHQAIGFSYDEQGRIGRCIANWDCKWILPIFPLYQRRWTRAKCVEYLREHIPHEVPRSSCVFCPFHKNPEWRWLRDHDPNGWNRAVEVDESLRVDGNVVNRNMNAQLFVHRSCVPLAQAMIDEPETTQLYFEFEGCTGGCAE